METPSRVAWQGKLENIDVKVLISSFLEREKVDIIVNTLSTSLDLNGRKLSAALSAEAGPGLEEALNMDIDEPYPGRVITTQGFNLKCKQIYHIVTPGFAQADSEEVIQRAVANCLLMGEECKYRSIAIPPVGTGGLGFSPEVVARRMLNALLYFQEEVKEAKHLVDIRFILFDTQVTTFVKRIREISKVDEKGINRIQLPVSHGTNFIPGSGIKGDLSGISLSPPSHLSVFAGLSRQRSASFSSSFIPWRWTSTSRAPPVHRQSEWLDLLKEFLFLEEHKSPILIHGSKLVGKTTFLSLIEEWWITRKQPPERLFRISGSDVLRTRELKSIILGRLRARGFSREQSIDLVQTYGPDMLVLIDDCECIPDSFFTQINDPMLSVMQYVLTVRSPWLERVSSLISPSDIVKLHGFWPDEVERYIQLYKKENQEAFDVLNVTSDIKLYGHPGYVQYACSLKDSPKYLDSDGRTTGLITAWLERQFVRNKLEKSSTQSWLSFLSTHGRELGKELFEYLATERQPPKRTLDLVTSPKGRLLKEVFDYSIALFLVSLAEEGSLKELSCMSLCYRIHSALALACGLSKSTADKIQVRIMHLSNNDSEIQAARESILMIPDNVGIAPLRPLSKLESECEKESQIHRMNENGPQVPLELKHLGPEYTLIYKKACEGGTKPIHQTRIMLVGHHHAGKTSLKRNLLSQPFVSEYQVTNSVDSDPSTCKVFIDDSDNWKLLMKGNNDTHDKEVAKHLHKLYVHLRAGQVRTLSTSKTTSSTRKASIDEPDTTTKSGDTDHNAVPTGDVPDAGHPIPDNEAHTEDILPEEGSELDSSDIEYLQEVIKAKIPKSVLHELAALVNGPSTQQKNETDFKFSFWDFAGQMVFYSTHQTFLTHRAIYLLVFDVTKTLEERIITYRQGRHEKIVDETSPQKVEDYLDYWMNCIHTHAKPREYSQGSSTVAPPVVIVCTHKDVLFDNDPASAEEVIKQYFISLNKFIEKKAYADHIHLEKYCVSNKDSQDPSVSALRKKLVEIAQEQVYWGELIPLKWLALKESLQTLKCLSRVTTLEEVKTEAQKAGIAEEEIITSLRFYHELGDIVFFNEPGLKDFIILDPQWLIDCFRKVITIPKFHEQHPFPNSQAHWRVLDETGVLHETILDAVWESGVKHQLVTLMYKFRLLLPISSEYISQLPWSEGQQETRGQHYLVPCLLPPKPSKPQANPQIPTVLVGFRNDFIPVGVLSRLFSSLVTEYGWHVADQIYHDYASFLPEGYEVRLCVHRKNSILEVCAFETEVNNPKSGHFLRPHLQTILKNLEVILRTIAPSARFVLKVWCQCHDVPKALVSVGPNGEQMDGKRSLFCNEHWESFSTSSYSPWFNVAADPKITMATAEREFPTEPNLMALSEKIGREWKQMAIYLGLSEPATQQASLDHPHDVVLCTFTSLLKWRNSSKEDREGKIAEIKEALRRCNRNDLIESDISGW